MERNNPTTSLEAYRQVNSEMLVNHHGKIISALKSAKNGLMYEQIAAQIKMDKHQVGRRLSELERIGVVYKPGEKRNTSTNRQAFVYKLVENGEVSAQPERMMKGESVSDISRKLIQPELF
jgi:predicted transcriptional regulator